MGTSRDSWKCPDHTVVQQTLLEDVAHLTQFKGAVQH